MLQPEPHQEQDIGAIQEHGEARLHWHSMGVLNPRGEALDLQEVTADVPGHVSQIRDGGHDADFCVHSCMGHQEHEHNGEQDECHMLHELTP